MAKGKTPAIMSPARGISSPGRFYTRTWRGKEFIQAWPKKQQFPRSEKEATARLLFKIAAESTKWMDTYQQEQAAAFAAVSVLLPRDILMMALFSRGWHLRRPDGKKLYSVVARQDTSAVLDSIGQTAGEMMIRGETEWAPLSKGTVGQVLLIGAAGDIEWGFPEAGGGGGVFSGTWSTGQGPTTAADAHATRATVFVPNVDLTIDGVSFMFSQGSGFTFEATIATMVGDVPGAAIDTIEGTGTGTGAAVIGLQIAQVPMTTPVHLTAGRPYYVMMSRTGGTGTTPLGSTYANFPAPCILFDWPGDVLAFLYFYNVLPVAPGTTPNVSAAATLFMAPWGRIGHL